MNVLRESDTIITDELVELDTAFYCGEMGLAYKRWVRRSSTDVDWVKWFPDDVGDGKATYQCGPDSNFPLEQKYQEQRT